MSELSVRETAARAARETIRLNERATWLDTADAVLAAVADHDGLADVLAGHSPVLSSHPTTHIVCCAGCEWVAPDTNSLWPEFAAHLADVVRAWLRGES